MGKEGGNKEEQAGRELVSLVPAADQVVRKYSLTVTQLYRQAVCVHHKEKNISPMVQ